jgi:protein ImuA
MHDSAKHPAFWRRGLAGIAPAPGGEGARLATGHDTLDRALGGGLARGRLHEVFAPDGGDAASAAGFAAMLALRLQEDTQAPLLWLRGANSARQGGGLYAPGLIELGADPARLLLAEAPDPLALLRCANDAARCAGLAGVVIESWGRMPALDLTASRRLALAARASGVTLLMLRLAAEPMPSAAETRWRIAAAASAPSSSEAIGLTKTPLEADAPGPPAFEIELLRWRSGPAGLSRRVEWNRDLRSFREPALPRAVVPVPFRRAVADRNAAAA